MASVNWQKLKTAGNVKAIMRHCDTQERQKHNHANADIDKEKTKDNINLLGLTYAESCATYDAWIAALDSKEGANKRKDRVTAFSLEFTCPDGLPVDMEEEWARQALAEIQGVLGNTLVTAYLHKDEKHEYFDKEKGCKVMSRDHVHAIYIPEIDGRLNGKKFSSKAHMQAVNTAIHKMTQREYCLDYMDGTKRKGRKTVETLKGEAEQAELAYMQQQYRQGLMTLKNREHELDAREIALDEKMNQLQAKITEKQKVLDNLTDEITEKQSVLSDLLVQIATMIKDLQRRMRTIYNKPSPEEQQKIVSEITQALENVENEMDLDF